ncbi:MAG: hypothetical protein QXH03_02695 [Candidatus Bathyarchaeia archaeon]
MKQNTRLEEEKAIRTLNAVIEALDYTAAHPERTHQLTYELVQKAPAIYESIIAITIPEHRNLIHELFIKALNLAKILTETKCR